ncbi:MAG: carbon storage regulator CsrA [Nitrospirota bacterium]|nr:carbon storage regulator CsrA [Nitrospirota bacterium]
MLVLTRKLGEGITIGDDIRVVVLEMKAGQVRLGIEAPSDVQVHRDEVYAKILDENKQAARAQPAATEALKYLGRPIQAEAKRV